MGWRTSPVGTRWQWSAESLDERRRPGLSPALLRLPRDHLGQHPLARRAGAEVSARPLELPGDPSRGPPRPDHRDGNRGGRQRPLPGLHVRSAGAGERRDHRRPLQPEPAAPPAPPSEAEQLRRLQSTLGWRALEAYRRVVCSSGLLSAIHSVLAWPARRLFLSRPAGDQELQGLQATLGWRILDAYRRRLRSSGLLSFLHSLAAWSARQVFGRRVAPASA